MSGCLKHRCSRALHLEHQRDWRWVAHADCGNCGDWGLKDDKWKGSFLVGSLGLSCRYKRFLFCLSCSSQLSWKKIFLTVYYLNSIFSIDQQAGQTAVLGRLSVSVCLWGSHNPEFCPCLCNLSLTIQGFWWSANRDDINSLAPVPYSICTKNTWRKRLKPHRYPKMYAINKST